MSHCRPPSYQYFQSALVDPNLLLEMGTTPSQPTCDPQRKQNPFMKVVIGTTPDNERTWNLPTSLLSQHSEYFRTICADPSTESIKLFNTAPSTFQNFTDYIYSSIYSLNTQALDHHPILSNVQAWLLGEQLGAPAFQDAAMRYLHKALAPSARDKPSGMARSPLRPADVQYVCAQTQPGSALRAVLFDGVASHWRQAEAEDLCYLTYCVKPDTLNAVVQSGTGTTWLDVTRAHDDFGKRLRNSRKVDDASRESMLRPAQDYIQGRLDWKEDEVSIRSEGRSRRAKRRLKTPILPRRDGLFARRKRDPRGDTGLMAEWRRRDSATEGGSAGARRRRRSKEKTRNAASAGVPSPTAEADI